MASPRPQPRFVLTGPSGWIGQAMLAHLAGRFGSPVADRVAAFGSSARDMTLHSGEVLPVRRLSSIQPDDIAGAHVIHLAYLTKEKAQELGERAFFDGNIAIDDALLGAIGKARPASLFVASSGAAALAERGQDLHPYGIAKLRQEARFLEWGKLAGVPVVAGRIFNVAGPYINKLDAYAISNFARQAESTGTISIQAAIPVFRSFLHVEDLSALVVEAALQGLGRERPMDFCGAEVVEMADIAELVGAACGGRAEIRRGPVDCTKSSAYLGDFTQTKAFAMQAGVRLSSLSRQVDDTVAWLRSNLQEPAGELADLHKGSNSTG